MAEFIDIVIHDNPENVEFRDDRDMPIAPSLVFSDGYRTVFRIQHDEIEKL